VLGVKVLRAYFITALLFCSLVSTLFFGIGNAEPSVPEFTVKFADYSYDVPASTSIDPYTGKTVNNPAQHIENKTLQISIKNQTIQSTEHLYYQIRMKGHFQPEWSNISYIQANPHSEYTVLTYALGGNNASGNFDSRLEEISSGDTLDFQVQAQIWHYVPSDDFYSQFGGGWLFRMSDYSDWSNTQTITISESQTPTPSPETTPFPTNYTGVGLTETEIIIGAIIAVAVIGAGLGLLIYLIKRK
jgi:hypothetical protein